MSDLSRENSFSSISSHEAVCDPLLSIPIPFRALTCAFDGYRTICIASDSGISCLSLSPTARLSQVIPHAFSAPPVLAPHASGGQIALYTPGDSAMTVLDMFRGIPLKVPFTSPKSRFITSIDWRPQDKFVLAAGTLSGTIQLWDLRSPAAPAHHSPFTHIPIEKVKFDPSSNDQFVLGSCQGNLIVLWDFRYSKSPTKTVVNDDSSFRIVDFDWFSDGGDKRKIFSVTENQTTFVIDDFVISESISGAYACVSLPSARRGGAPRLAVSCDDGPAIVNPITGDIIESIPLDHSTSTLGFLQESHLLCSFSHSANQVYLRAIRGLSRSSKSVTDLSPRELKKSSSHELAPPTDQFASQRLLLSQLAQKLRRMYWDVRVEDLGLIVSRPIAVDEEEGINVLNISLEAVSVDEFKFDYWWSKSGNTINLEKNFIPLSIDSPISNFVSVFKNIQILLETNYPAPTAYAESVISPFPATCGVCWSPRGDLYRFNSIRGLFPWPQNREKLTMKNFLGLQDEMEKIVPRNDSNAKNSTSQLLRSEINSFRLNRISVFEEPLDKLTETTDILDTEFDRRISIDQCVQFVPWVIFEETVEDHWFASIASIVHLEDQDKPRIARTVQEFSEKLMVSSNARLPPVVSSWRLCEQIFVSHHTDTSSGFYSILNFVFQEQLKKLYLEEQTQAVAILATIGSQLGLTISDPSFFHSVQLGIHDHANLFQRLQNWKNARIMEKNSPFSMVPENVVFKAAPRSQSVACAICDSQVRGLVELCIACGHGGHIRHIEKYFEFAKKCPYLHCECLCRGNR